jgi:hypothetical protein
MESVAAGKPRHYREEFVFSVWFYPRLMARVKANSMASKQN